MNLSDHTREFRYRSFFSSQLLPILVSLSILFVLSPQHTANLIQTGQGIGKKTCIGLTVVILSRRRPLCQTLPAAAIAAQRIPPANLTFLRDDLRIFYKPKASPGLIQLLPGMTKNITQPVLVQPIEVAGVHTSVRLHKVLQPAASPHGTLLWSMSVQHPYQIVKIADRPVPPICQFLIPQVDRKSVV